MPKKFNPNEFVRKITVYRRTSYPGVCIIYDWNPEKKRYVQRSKGLRYYSYRKIDGRQRSKCFGTFDEAKKWRDNPFLAGSASLEGCPTFAQVKERYFEHLQSRVRTTTYETYVVNVRHLGWFDQFPVTSIQAQLIDRWLKEVKNPSYLASQHQTRLTYEHELRLLRQILTHYAEYLDGPGTYQVPVKKRHFHDAVVDAKKYQERKAMHAGKFMDRKDCERFLGYLAERSSGSTVDRIVYLVAFFHLRTGSRVGEACSLRWEDLDLRTGQGVLCRTVHWARIRTRKTCVFPATKTGKIRPFFINDRNLLDELRNWRLQSGRSDGVVFSVNGVDPIGYRAIQYRFNRAFRGLRIEYRSTHILRHSFGTDFLEKTKNPLALQQLLGHSDIQQTQHYAKTTDVVVEEAVKSYGKTFENLKEEGRQAG